MKRNTPSLPSPSKKGEGLSSSTRRLHDRRGGLRQKGGSEYGAPPPLWGTEFTNGCEKKSPPSLWGRVREGGRIAPWRARPHSGFERIRQRPSNACGRGCAAGNSMGISFAARRLSDCTSSISSVPRASSWSKSMAASTQGRLGAMQNARHGFKVRDTKLFDSGITTSLEIPTASSKPSLPHFAKSNHTPSPTLPHLGGGGKSHGPCSASPIEGGVSRFPCADRDHA